MREVTLFWKRARLVKSDVGIMCEVCAFAEFIGYIERRVNNVRIILRVIFNEGFGIDDLNNISYIQCEEIMLKPQGNENEWILLVKLSHKLTNLNARTGRTHTIPGSRLDQEGIHYSISGSPLSLKLVVGGAKMLFKPDRVSARGLSAKKVANSGILSPQQIRIAKAAFDRGWYNVPREITMSNLALELKIARSTLSEHLGRIETALMHDLFDSFSTSILTEEQEALLNEQAFGGREESDEIQVELDRVFAIELVDDTSTFIP